MPTDIPPPRFKVVERGRRLEVIDTQAPRAMRQPAVRGQPDARPGRWPRQIRFDGTRAFVTHRLYDAKAPRTIELDPAAGGLFGAGPAAVVGIVVSVVLLLLVLLSPWLLIPPFLAFANPPFRQRVRAGVTRMLDRWEAPAA